MHKQTVYLGSVAAVVLALVLSLAVPVEAATSAQELGAAEVAGQALSGEVPAVLQVAPATHGGICLLCYSCGSFWPHVRGFVYPPAGSATWELASGCGGSFDLRHDSRPNFCCSQ